MSENGKAKKGIPTLLIAISALLVIILCGVLLFGSGDGDGDDDNDPTGRIMYFCGYDRCRDSGSYGEMIYQTGINVWNNPDPDRGGVHHQADHHERVMVVEEKRVNEGPGGLWYRLEGGGWTNDLWLARGECTSENLEQYSFTDCLMGEY